MSTTQTSTTEINVQSDNQHAAQPYNQPDNIKTKVNNKSSMVHIIDNNSSVEYKYVEEKQLVTVEKITSVVKHPNADSLYIVRVQGYDVIINLKSMYGDVDPESLVGKHVVYFQIDSVIPETFSNCTFWYYLDNTYMGKRVRSVKLRGVISQGLILDFDSLRSTFSHIAFLLLPEGFNLTNELGVIKYYHIYDAEGPFYTGSFDRTRIRTRPCPGNLKPFPEYIPKTDQTRLQANIRLIKHLPETRLFTATVKFDGQSTTWFYYNGDVGVCSRNYRLDLEYDKDPTVRDQANDKFRQINEKYDILNKLKAYGKNIAIQGELYGMAINNNRHHRNDVELAVFDVYDIDKRCYISHNRVNDLCFQFVIPMVDIVMFNNEPYENKPLISTEVEQWIELANAQRYKGSNKKELQAEGIVVKTSDDKSPYISFKVISPEFLVKYNL